MTLKLWVEGMPLTGRIYNMVKELGGSKKDGSKDTSNSYKFPRKYKN